MHQDATGNARALALALASAHTPGATRPGGLETTFTEEWVGEHEPGRPRSAALRKAGARHRVESVGAELRAMMPFVSGGRERIQDVSGG